MHLDKTLSTSESGEDRVAGGASRHFCVFSDDDVGEGGEILDDVCCRSSSSSSRSSKSPRHFIAS